MELLPYIEEGKQCEVIKGAHKGKKGIISKLKLSRSGNLTITVTDSNNVRFKKFARNVKVLNSNVPKNRYITLGDYFDNNDGTYYYYPEEDTKEAWRNAFCDSDLIQFFLLVQLETDFDESVFGNCLDSAIKAHKEELDRFLEKYYYGEKALYNADGYFEETIWFHSGNTHFQYWFNELMEYDTNFFFENQVFIIDSEYDDFVKSLDDLVEKILK